MSNIKFYAPVDFDDTSSGVTIDGDLIVDTNTLFVDVSTDRVGIGTASPSANLHIAGGVTILGQNKIDGSSDNLKIMSDYAGVSGSSTIEFSVDNSEKMRITNGGDVGIGTTSPAKKLDVNGDSYIRTSGTGQTLLIGRTSSQPTIKADSTNGGYLILDSLNNFLSLNHYVSQNVVACSGGGNLLVGTATDGGYKLNVNGTAYASEFDLPSGGQLDWANGDARIIEGDVSNYSLSFQTYTGSALTTKMFINSGGNIGLGTTSPTQKLQVSSGDIMIDSGNAIHLTTTADHTKVQRSNNGLELFAGSSARVHVNDNGNVGIGTTSPSQKFHVVGNVRIDDGYTLGWGADTTKIAGNSSANTLAFKTSSADRLYINSSGNVGIGTTGPSDKLHVSGGNMFLDNGYGLRWGDNSVGIYGNASNETISMYTSSSERARITSGGNVLIGTTTDAGATVHIRQSSSGQSPINSPSLFVENNGSSNSYYALQVATTGGGHSFNVTNAGNVGIGTTSPLGRLHVEDSSVRSSVNSGANNIVIEENGYSGITILSSNLNAGQIHFGDQDAENAGMIQYFHSDNSMRLTTNAGERMRITSGGNVLIGTTTDGGYKLNVNGTAFAQTAYVDDYIYHAGDTNTAVGFLDDAIEFYAGGVKMIKLTEGSADVVTVNPDSADVNFQVHGDTVANLLFVDGGTSKVGIGTSSPAYRLDIKGTSNNIGDGNQIFSVGNTAGGTQLAIGSSEDSYTWIRSYESGVGGRDLALVTNGEAVRIKSLGNVLIGTTTDSGQKLQVNGSVLASDYIGSTHIYLSSPDSWIFRSTGGTERMRLTSAGNLGIGTSSPAYKLDVTGELRATSVLRANSNTIVGGYIDLTGDFFHRDDIKVLNKAANNWLTWAQRDTAASEVVVDLNYIGTITPGSDSAYDIGTNTVRFANGYFDTLYGDGSNLTGITATETDTLDSVTGRGATTTNSITVGGLTVDTSTLHVDATNNRVGVGTASPSNKLHIVGDLFLKGSDTSTSTKAFQVQTGNGTSIMDFRNDTYAFFGCGQGGGSASGFIFRWSSTFGVQFTGYNYGNGTSPSYKPILMDTDLVGRSQGVYVNYGITGYTAPAPTTTTEFAVRGRGTSTGYTAKFEDSSTNPLLYIKDNGNVTVGTATDSGYKLDVEGNTNTNGDYYVNGNQGWSGTITINTNPQVSITVEGGIITNVT